MRFFGLIATVLCLAGCPGANVPIYGGVPYSDGGCKESCDKCPTGTFCITVPYQPTCLKTCMSDNDCSGGEKCALLDLANIFVTGCVAADRPMTCSAHTCSIKPKCKDAKTLYQPLPFDNLVCGWEMVTCPTACDAATAQCT